MKKNNPLYKNQGIHAVNVIFSVQDGVNKVLLTRKQDEPYKGRWLLIGGGVYNNEEIIDGAKRELFEKSGLSDVELELAAIYSNPDRTKDIRMIAISYIGIISGNVTNLIKNVTDLEWFPINKIPKLGFDHDQILGDAIKILKEKVTNIDVLKRMFKTNFTLPELQRLYEMVFERTYDRRNFRRKMLDMGVIEEIGFDETNCIGRPPKLYRFKDEAREYAFE